MNESRTAMSSSTLRGQRRTGTTSAGGLNLNAFGSGSVKSFG